MTGERRVALISDAAGYVGPSLARLLAPLHDLVVGDPEHGLVADLGRLDAAVAFTGRIVVGRFLRSSVDDLRDALVGCVEAPYQFLRGVVPAMVERGGGQVLVFTSAAGARPTPGAPLYSSARAAANMLIRNVAEEVVGRNVQVNAIGTNFMDFPGSCALTGPRSPRAARGSRQWCRWDGSAPWRSSPTWRCRSSTEQVDSPPDSSWASPEGGSDPTVALPAARRLRVGWEGRLP